MNKSKLNQLGVKVTSTTVYSDSAVNITNPEIESNDVSVTNIHVSIYNPALEQVKKEWEDDGYTWEENEDFITIYREDPLDENLVKEILINKSRRTYECYDASDYDSQSLSLTLEEHARLTKTFIAKGWKV